MEKKPIRFGLKFSVEADGVPGMSLDIFKMHFAAAERGMLRHLVHKSSKSGKTWKIIDNIRVWPEGNSIKLACMIEETDEPFNPNDYPEELTENFEVFELGE